MLPSFPQGSEHPPLGRAWLELPGLGGQLLSQWKAEDQFGQNLLLSATNNTRLQPWLSSLTSCTELARGITPSIIFFAVCVVSLIHKY